MKLKGYICHDCAEDNEGEWPEGHVATFHQGKCTACEKERSLGHVTDWNWPKDLDMQSFSDGCREF